MLNVILDMFDSPGGLIKVKKLPLYNFIMFKNDKNIFWSGGPIPLDKLWAKNTAMARLIYGEKYYINQMLYNNKAAMGYLAYYYPKNVAAIYAT